MKSKAHVLNFVNPYATFKTSCSPFLNSKSLSTIYVSFMFSLNAVPPDQPVINNMVFQIGNDQPQAATATIKTLVYQITLYRQDAVISGIPDHQPKSSATSSSFPAFIYPAGRSPSVMNDIAAFVVSVML